MKQAGRLASSELPQLKAEYNAFLSEMNEADSAFQKMLIEAKSLPEFQALQDMRMQMRQEASGLASKYPMLFRQLNYLSYIGKAAWPIEIGFGALETYMADPGQHIRTGFGAVGAIGGAAFGGAIGKELFEEGYDELDNYFSSNGNKP